MSINSLSGGLPVFVPHVDVGQATPSPSSSNLDKSKTTLSSGPGVKDGNDTIPSRPRRSITTELSPYSQEWQEAASDWNDLVKDEKFRLFCANFGKPDIGLNPDSVVVDPDGTMEIFGNPGDEKTKYMFFTANDTLDDPQNEPDELNSLYSEMRPRALQLAESARVLGKSLSGSSVASANFARVDKMTSGEMAGLRYWHDDAMNSHMALRPLYGECQLLNEFAEIYRNERKQQYNAFSGSEIRFSFDYKKFSTRVGRSETLRNLMSQSTGIPATRITPEIAQTVLNKLANSIKGEWAKDTPLPASDDRESRNTFRQALARSVNSWEQGTRPELADGVIDFAANVLLNQRQVVSVPPSVPSPADNSTPHPFTPTLQNLPPNGSPLPSGSPTATPGKKPNTSTDDTKNTENEKPTTSIGETKVTEEDDANLAEATPVTNGTDWKTVAGITTLVGSTGVLIGFLGKATGALTATKAAAVTALGMAAVASGGTLLAVVSPGAINVIAASAGLANFGSSLANYAASYLSGETAGSVLKGAAVVRVGGSFALVGVGTYKSAESLENFINDPNWKNGTELASNVLGTIGAGFSAAPAANKSGLLSDPKLAQNLGLIGATANTTAATGKVVSNQIPPRQKQAESANAYSLPPINNWPPTTPNRTVVSNQTTPRQKQAEYANIYSLPPVNNWPSKTSSKPSGQPTKEPSKEPSNIYHQIRRTW